MRTSVLIIDDDAQILESLGKVLRHEGYEIQLAANGHDGLAKFFERNIDLVLLDLNLPGNSGWDIFGTMTSFNPFIPIVIITGRHNEHELATRAGVGALMEKPLDVPLLLKTIAELIAEEAENHLKRLAGFHHGIRYAPMRNSNLANISGENFRHSTK